MISDLPPYFDQRCFLTSCNQGILDYVGSDSEEKFLKNLKIQPDTWHYRTKEVKYRHNSHGYRSKEWNDIDWAESVVILGCSLVYGVGVAEDETISHYLSSITNRSVINLGQPGTSMQFSFYNSIKLKKYFPTPYAVIQLWTSPDRLLIADDERFIHLGPWSRDKMDIFKLLNGYRYNTNFHIHHILEADKLLWDDTKYISDSLFKDSPAKMQNQIAFNPQLDKARDCIHHGPKINAIIAQHLASKLEETQSY